MTHASVPAVALSLFSPFPGPFMGFRWPYLYFFSCINMLAQLGSSNVITWKFPCLCLLIASLSSLLIHWSKCLGFLPTALELIFRDQRIGLSSLATVCVVPLNFWVSVNCLGVQLGWQLLGAPCLLQLFQTEAAAQCLTCVVHRFEKTFLN